MRGLTGAIRSYLNSLAHLRHAQVVEARGAGHITMEGRKYLDFASNDYLGLGELPLDHLTHSRASSSASRLLGAGLPELREAERFLAWFFGFESAVLFPSGFQANLAAIGALSLLGIPFYVDREAHASIKTALLASRARFHLYEHLSVSHLQRRMERHGPGIVITEGIFSMSGRSPSQQLYEIIEKNGIALYSDEAHALGMAGPGGRGVMTGQGDVVVGTLGKAYGLWGAFVLGPAELPELLANGALPFIYTTAPSPVLASAIRPRIERAARMEQERSTLMGLASRLRASLRAIVPARWTVSGDAQITFVQAGDDAEPLSAFLMERSIWCPVIRPPTVSIPGIRISLTVHHTWDDVARLVEAVSDFLSDQAVP